MLNKKTATLAALAAALATSALAQQPGSSTPQQGPPAFVQSQQGAGDWRGTKLIGASVYGPDNASIGEISDVLIDNNGIIRAVVVGVSGFLDVAVKDVAIPFKAMSIKRGPVEGTIDKVTVNYSKDDLKNAPHFAFDQSSSPSTTGSGLAPATNSTPMKK